jgi:hypothetical protein
LVVSAWAFADEPLPEIRLDGPNVRIKNVGSQPLTAYWYEVRIPNRNATEGVDGSALAPGGETVNPSGALDFDAPPEAAKMIAAIYADGSPAGDPVVVEQILEGRRALLRATRQLIARFEGAESSGLSKTALRAELAQMQTGVAMLASRALDQRSIAEELAALRRNERWQMERKPSLE